MNIELNFETVQALLKPNYQLLGLIQYKLHDYKRENDNIDSKYVESMEELIVFLNSQIDNLRMNLQTIYE